MTNEFWKYMNDDGKEVSKEEATMVLHEWFEDGERFSELITDLKVKGDDSVNVGSKSD